MKQINETLIVSIIILESFIQLKRISESQHRFHKSCIIKLIITVKAFDSKGIIFYWQLTLLITLINITTIIILSGL